MSKNLKKSELYELCKEHGIKVTRKTKKSEMIDLLAGVGEPEQVQEVVQEVEAEPERKHAEYKKRFTKLRGRLANRIQDMDDEDFLNCYSIFSDE